MRTLLAAAVLFLTTAPCQATRWKDPLEAFELRTLRYYSQDAARPSIAYIAVGEYLYRVEVGDHLGKNYGKIIAITPDEIQIDEIYQTKAGSWEKRRTSLPFSGSPQVVCDENNNNCKCLSHCK